MIVPCPRKFADMVEEMRPDWPRAEFEGALAAAGSARPEGRDVADHWARVVATITPILCDPDATTSAVLDAVTNPLSRKPGAAAGPTAEFTAALGAMTGAAGGDAA